MPGRQGRICCCGPRPRPTRAWKWGVLSPGPTALPFRKRGLPAPAPSTLWKALDRLPFRTHLNVGLESADPATLKALGKPLTPGDVERAFERMLEINREYANLEVSANFVFGGELAAGHLNSLVSLDPGEAQPLLRQRGGLPVPAPARSAAPPEGRKRLLGDFRGLKTQSRLPAYLYLIQRL